MINIEKFQKGKIYSLGKDYIDKGSRLKIKEDQFLRWINLDGSGMKNMEGIRTLKYIYKVKTNLHAAIVLVTTHTSRNDSHNPWEDDIDLPKGKIKYWGDAKFHKTKKCEDWQGNKALINIYNHILEHKNSSFIPPILHFSKHQKGKIRFNGLCVLDKLENSWYEDEKGNPVRNLLCHLTILDCEDIKVDWLHQRRLLNDNKKSPIVWKKYLNGLTKKLFIYTKSILKNDDQIPEKNSIEMEMIKLLHKLSPEQFEEAIIQILEKNGDVIHNIEGTRHVRDGGFDFFGNFLLPGSIDYNINFKGEVKKYKTSNPVTPKDVSRLVARLQRGEYGIFITTSYFSKQAQEEVLSDNYPVKLISGMQLLSIMKSVGLISKGKIKKEWIDNL